MIFLELAMSDGRLQMFTKSFENGKDSSGSAWKGKAL